MRNWIGLALLAAALQTPQTFRVGIDVVQVEVSVLDKNRRPVKGLTAGDFSVFEDGAPRSIVAFAPVDLPPVEAAPPAWRRTAAADVVTNQVPDEGRLVVILLDRSIPVGEPAAVAREIATAAIDALGPGDEAAVVYTFAGRPQGFTADRARLRRALEPDPSGEVSDEALAIEAGLAAAMSAATGQVVTPISNTGSCYCGLCGPESVAAIADAVRDVPRRRKVLLYIGSRLILQGAAGDTSRTSITSDVECSPRLTLARNRMFSALDLANMTVHSIDPQGLMVVPTSARGAALQRGGGGNVTDERLQQQLSLRVLPDYTGGRTVVNTNGGADQARDIIRESDSYYLLGFRSADASPGSRLHQLSVKVNRPGVTVTTRKRYYAPGATTPAGAGSRSDADPLAESIRSVVPRRDLNLTIAAAPVAASGNAPSGVLVTVGVEETSGASAGAATALVAAFSRTGRPIVAHRQRVAIDRPSGVTSLYEVVDRLPLKPATYELRVAVQEGEKIASVYTFVDVPDFARAPLSLSGVMVSSSPAVPSTATADILDPPQRPPTARREFATTDQVSLAVRIYQGGSGAPAPVEVHARVLDAKNRLVFERRFTASHPDAARREAFTFDLPVATLAPGTYLARIEASRGRSVATRDVVFSMR